MGSTIFNKTSTKYSRSRQINLANTKLTAHISAIRNRIIRATHVRKQNDEILRMEQDSGEITVLREFQEDTETWGGAVLKCARCGYGI